MKRHMRRAAILAWLMVIAALPGCGAKKVKITGKLMKNGQPLMVSRDTSVMNVFIPDTDTGTVNPQTLLARFQRATEAYEIELLAGAYRINYIITEKGQQPGHAPPEQKAKSYDLTKNQEVDIEIKLEP
jgi:hypothetical protein